MNQLTFVPVGPEVRIPGFHPGGPGSIPGQGAEILLPITDAVDKDNHLCRLSMLANLMN